MATCAITPEKQRCGIYIAEEVPSGEAESGYESDKKHSACKRSSGDEADLEDGSNKKRSTYKCSSGGDCTIYDYIKGSECCMSAKNGFHSLCLPKSSYEELQLDLILSKQSEVILEKFADLAVNTFEGLSKIAFEDAQRYTNHLVSTRIYDSAIFSRQPVRNCISETTSHKELEKELMENYYSWFNFGMIKNLRKKFLFQDGGDEPMQTYEEEFSQYCRRRCFESPLSFHPRPVSTNLKSLVFKTDANYNEYTLLQARKITTTVASIMNSPDHAIYVESVKEGCVEVSCYILPQFELECLSDLQISQLKENNIFSFKIEDKELMPKFQYHFEQHETTSDSEGYDASSEEESDSEEKPRLISKEGTCEAADDSKKVDKGFDILSSQFSANGAVSIPEEMKIKTNLRKLNLKCEEVALAFISQLMTNLKTVQEIKPSLPPTPASPETPYEESPNKSAFTNGFSKFNFNSPRPTVTTAVSKWHHGICYLSPQSNQVLAMTKVEEESKTNYLDVLARVRDTTRRKLTLMAATATSKNHRESPQQDNGEKKENEIERGGSLITKSPPKDEDKTAKFERVASSGTPPYQGSTFQGTKHRASDTSSTPGSPYSSSNLSDSSPSDAVFFEVTSGEVKRSAIIQNENSVVPTVKTNRPLSPHRANASQQSKKVTSTIATKLRSNRRRSKYRSRPHCEEKYDTTDIVTQQNGIVQTPDIPTANEATDEGASPAKYSRQFWKVWGSLEFVGLQQIASSSTVELGQMHKRSKKETREKKLSLKRHNLTDLIERDSSRSAAMADSPLSSLSFRKKIDMLPPVNFIESFKKEEEEMLGGVPERMATDSTIHHAALTLSDDSTAPKFQLNDSSVVSKPPADDSAQNTPGGLIHSSSLMSDELSTPRPLLSVFSSASSVSFSSSYQDDLEKVGRTLPTLTIHLNVPLNLSDESTAPKFQLNDSSLASKPPADDTAKNTPNRLTDLSSFTSSQHSTLRPLCFGAFTEPYVCCTYQSSPMPRHFPRRPQSLEQPNGINHLYSFRKQSVTFPPPPPARFCCTIEESVLPSSVQFSYPTQHEESHPSLATPDISRKRTMSLQQNGKLWNLGWRITENSLDFINRPLKTKDVSHLCSKDSTHLPDQGERTEALPNLPHLEDAYLAVFLPQAFITNVHLLYPLTNVPSSSGLAACAIRILPPNKMSYLSQHGAQSDGTKTIIRKDGYPFTASGVAAGEATFIEKTYGHFDDRNNYILAIEGKNINWNSVGEDTVLYMIDLNQCEAIIFYDYL